MFDDAKAYERFLDELDYAETVRTLQERIANYQRGEEGVDMEAAFRRIRAALGLNSPQ